MKCSEDFLDSWEIRFVKETAFKDGKIAGKLEEKEVIAQMMLLNNEPLDKIVKYTQLSIAQIETLQNK